VPFSLRNTFVDGRVAVAISEAGGVAHELAHGGRVVRLGEEHLPVESKPLKTLRFANSGMYSRWDRRGATCLLRRDHHGDAGDGLGHGVVREDGVLVMGRRWPVADP